MNRWRKMNRWGKLKWMGCIKSDKNGKRVIDKKRLEEVTGYIPTFSKSEEN